MHARVANYEVPLDRIEDDIRQAVEIEKAVRAIPGNKGLYYFVNRETGHTMSMSLFETEEALGASATQAANLRRELTQPTGAKIVSVEEFETVVMPAEMR